MEKINRKRRATHYLSSMLAMPALVCLSLVLFTACSDNDSPTLEPEVQPLLTKMELNQISADKVGREVVRWLSYNIQC